MIIARRNPRPTRRTVGRCTVLLAVVASAGVACGGDDHSSPASTAAPASTEAPATSVEDSTGGVQATDPAPATGATVTADSVAGAFPVQVEHQLGTITIDEPPQRVVAMSSRDADTLLALGVTPVGSHSRYDFESGVGPWAEHMLGDIEPAVWPGPEFNYEAVASVDPDLIVYTASGGDSDVYETLSGIAPVVDLPVGAVPYGATPDESAMLIGHALGREFDAERVVAGLADYLAEHAAAQPSFAGRTANYLDIYSGGITSYSQEHIVNRILYSVGFAPTPGSVADRPGIRRRLPREPVGVRRRHRARLSVRPHTGPVGCRDPDDRDAERVRQRRLLRARRPGPLQQLSAVDAGSRLVGTGSAAEGPLTWGVPRWYGLTGRSVVSF